LSQQLLRNPGTQWNRAEHNFVIARTKGELAGTGTLLPAPGAKWVGISYSKPVQLLGLTKFKPLENLTLFTGHRESVFELFG
jgi:hypothetical protein